MGKSKGQNKGHRSLEKRLGPREKCSGNNRGENRSSGKSDGNLGLRVRSIRDWFEGRKEALASRKVSGTEEFDPATAGPRE